jgi:dTMP kinase
LGKVMRRALLEVAREDLASAAEVFLYLADRAQHVERVIRPALESHNLVLCDRFADSTVAYQGYGRGFDLALLRSLNSIASQGITPDLTFLLDLSPSLGLARTRARGLTDHSNKHGDRFEQETLEFHERVRQGFLEQARAEPERIVVLDATLSAEELREQIKSVVARRLAQS